MTQDLRSALEQDDEALELLDAIDRGSAERQLTVSCLVLAKVLVNRKRSSLFIVPTSTGGAYALVDQVPLYLMQLDQKMLATLRAIPGVKVTMPPGVTIAQPLWKLLWDDACRPKVQILLPAALALALLGLGWEALISKGAITAERPPAFDSLYQTLPMMTMAAAGVYLAVYSLFTGLARGVIESYPRAIKRLHAQLYEGDRVSVGWALTAIAASFVGLLLYAAPDISTIPPEGAISNFAFACWLAECARLTLAALVIALGCAAVVPPLRDTLGFLVGRHYDLLGVMIRDGVADDIASALASAKQSKETEDTEETVPPS